jgi:hypothetical protein
MIGLSLLMWLLQTIDNALALYQTWLAFILDPDDHLQSVLILEGLTGPSFKIRMIRRLLWTMLPGIADTIMASIAQFYNIID